MCKLMLLRRGCPLKLDTQKVAQHEVPTLRMLSVCSLRAVTVPLFDPSDLAFCKGGRCDGAVSEAVSEGGQ
jgi:hypothetical protein